jgi:hypothetical protein
MGKRMNRSGDSGLKLWLPRIFSALAVVVLLSAFMTPTASAACNSIPKKPKLVTPQAAIINARKADLKWEKADCANHYNIEIRKGNSWGRPVDARYAIEKTDYRSRRLETGQTYYWHIEACNVHGCKASRWGTFSLAK